MLPASARNCPAGQNDASQIALQNGMKSREEKRQARIPDAIQETT